MAPSSPSPPSPDAEIARLQAAVADLQTRVAALERETPHSPSALSRSTPSAESHVGLTILNRVGAITLIIGIIFFFKYAADNEWIGAATAVVFGLLAGLALIGTGDWLRLRGQQAFAQGLAGCGLAILYVSVYAAFGYYHILLRGAAFAGMVAASALAIVLSFRFASAAVAAVGFIGAFVAPVLIHEHRDSTRPGLYFVYLLAFSVASVTSVSRLYRPAAQKSALFLAAFNAFWMLLCTWILINERHPASFILFTLVFAAVHFIAAFRLDLSSPLRATLYTCGHACLLIAGLRAVALWADYAVAFGNRANFKNELDSVLLAVYAVAVICYGLLRKSAVDRTLGLVLLGVVVVKLYFYDVWLMTSFYRISAFVVLGILLITASYVYSRFRQRRDSA